MIVIIHKGIEYRRDQTSQFLSLNVILLYILKKHSKKPKLDTNSVFEEGGSIRRTGII